MFMKNVSDMRIVMQRVSFSPESGGVWKPKITCARKDLNFLFLCFESLVSAYHAGDEYTRSDEVVEVVDGAPPDVDLETFEELVKSFVSWYISLIF